MVSFVIYMVIIILKSRAEIRNFLSVKYCSEEKYISKQLCNVHYINKTAITKVSRKGDWLFIGQSC